MKPTSYTVFWTVLLILGIAASADVAHTARYVGAAIGFAVFVLLFVPLQKFK